MAVKDTSAFDVRTGAPVAGDRRAIWAAGAEEPDMIDVVNEGPIYILKTATETRTASAVLANDAVLAIPMLANTKYFFRIVVFYDTTTAADFKYRHAGPASPTLVRIRRTGLLNSGTAFSGIGFDTAYSAADVQMLSAVATGGWVMIEGIVHNGANAGNLTFQWSQDTSDAGNTSVLAGSYAEYRKIG